MRNASTSYTGLTYDPSLVALAAVGGVPASLVGGRHVPAGTRRPDRPDLAGRDRGRAEPRAGRLGRPDGQADLHEPRPGPGRPVPARQLRRGAPQPAGQASNLLMYHDRDRRDHRPDQQAPTLARLKVNWRPTPASQGPQPRRRPRPSVYKQERETLEDISQQRTECKIVAPDDIEEGSMVVYFKRSRGRFGNTTRG